MNTNVLINGAVATLELSGRFDFSAHRDFKDAYMTLMQNHSVLVIDVNLSAVDYMDSSALGMLLMLRDRTQAANKEVTLSQPSKVVSQILDVANFSKLFNIS
jgi:HptB-dependent secretion and biofilm anti anti-sigma factor